MWKPALLVALVAGVVHPPSSSTAAPGVPEVFLHTPRGATQEAGVLAVTCMSSDRGSITDYFQVGWPPVRVRRGSPLVLRFERPEQPSDVELRGPRGPLAFTLQPHAPSGSVSAWDVRFAALGKAPRRAVQERGGKKYFTVTAEATWFGEEDCSSYKRGEWASTFRQRRAQR